MKKLTILITIFFFNLSIYSQAPRGFYLAAGFNQTDLKSSDLLSEGKPGFYTSLNMLMGYHENYNYQLEIGYKQNNIDVKYVEGDFSGAKTSKYKYADFNFGLYLNYYILKPEEDEFFVGPQAGIFATVVDPFAPAKGSDVTGQYYLPYLLDENDLSNSSKFNYGVGLGITGGYNRFRFDLRYSLGLVNTLGDVEVNSYNETNTYTGPSLSGKTNSLTFGISYKIFAFTKE
ncbi:outer membrane beta-barrel protein [Flavobacterium sp. HTF]|uniref:outer membrane beta-barrel protein n=1 Tax=Flavobacterium sp. HTF TaxID=2170732 RepID=UPI000D5CD6AE|nr:outer membrane beta-barrel protein [Flavobacterium sp. HTF]PWB28443.1 hypothetical protein DCO46_00610 [Flavobacterium sp. HTF]